MLLGDLAREDLLADLTVGGDAAPVVLFGLGVTTFGLGDLAEHPDNLSERVLVSDLDQKLSRLLGQLPRLPQRAYDEDLGDGPKA